MDPSKRSKVLTVILVTLVVATVCLFVFNSKPKVDKPTASNYYTGAFRNKKNPNMWGDANGKQAPAPADAIPYNADSSSTGSPGAGGHVKE